MILLWINVAIISAVVMAILMFSLLRSSDQERAERGEYDLTVYRDQLSEIDRDLARGLLSEDQAAAARVEVQRRMLAAAGDAKGGGKTGGRGKNRGAANVGLFGLIPRAIEQGPWGIATLAAVFAVIPMGALALYLVIGSPWLPGQPHAQRVAQAEQEQMASLPGEVRGEIEDRRAAVEQAPESAEAWLALGRAYRHAELHDQAVDALEKAADLGLPEDVRAIALGELGESLVIKAQGRVTEGARQRFLEALRAEAGEPRARFYLGMGAAQDGNPRRALAIWIDLAADSPSDAPWMSMVSQGMAVVSQKAGIPLESITPAHPLELESGAVELLAPPVPAEGEGAAGDPGARMRAEADAAREPGEDFSDDEQAMIRGMVDGLAARLEENPDDVEGWLRLADSRGVLGEWDGAVAAAERAAEQAPEDPGVLIHAADIMLGAMGAAGEVDPPARVYELYEAVLEQDPENAKALYFIGLGAAQDGNVARARDLWERLLVQIPEDQPARAAIQRQLDALPSE
jgi:cytochrome c-type biogenesis protein CcmH